MKKNKNVINDMGMIQRACDEQHLDSNDVWKFALDCFLFVFSFDVIVESKIYTYFHCSSFNGTRSSCLIYTI